MRNDDCDDSKVWLVLLEHACQAPQYMCRKETRIGTNVQSMSMAHLPCKSLAYLIELTVGQRAVHNDRASHSHLGLCIAPHDSIRQIVEASLHIHPLMAQSAWLILGT